jgi:hypothetical protein
VTLEVIEEAQHAPSVFYGLDGNGGHKIGWI